MPSLNPELFEIWETVWEANIRILVEKSLNPTGLGFLLPPDPSPTSTNENFSPGFSFSGKNIGLAWVFSIQKKIPIFNELLWLFFVDQGEILGETHTHTHSWGDFLTMSTGLPHFWKVHGASE